MSDFVRGMKKVGEAISAVISAEVTEKAAQAKAQKNSNEL